MSYNVISSVSDTLIIFSIYSLYILYVFSLICQAGPQTRITTVMTDLPTPRSRQPGRQCGGVRGLVQWTSEDSSLVSRSKPEFRFYFPACVQFARLEKILDMVSDLRF